MIKNFVLQLPAEAENDYEMFTVIEESDNFVKCSSAEYGISLFKKKQITVGGKLFFDDNSNTDTATASEGNATIVEVTLCEPQPQHSPSPEKWEYKLKDSLKGLMEKDLNELGGDGWELTSAFPITIPATQTEEIKIWIRYHFKRPVHEAK